MIKAYLSLMVPSGCGLAVALLHSLLHSGFQTANRDLMSPVVEKSAELNTAMALKVYARKQHTPPLLTSYWPMQVTCPINRMEEHKERRDQKEDSKYFRQIIQYLLICSLGHKYSLPSLLHEKYIPPHPKEKYLPKFYLIMSSDPKSKIYFDSYCTWSICGYS